MSATASIDKEYRDFVKMSPAETSKWLNNLVLGLKRQEERPASTHENKDR